MRFLLTPLREGRRLTLEQLEMRVHISTHAPAGGATSGAGANGIARSHFYSRPCGRGDPAASRRPDNVLISTHAPAGGATLVNHNDAGRIDLISTHAPAGGATRFRPNGNGCRKLFLLTPLREGRRPRPSAPPACSVFLLTPLREGRLAGGSFVQAKYTISTHAPAGGATSCKRRCPVRGIYFYSRPCGRGDSSCASGITADI